MEMEISAKVRQMERYYEERNTKAFFTHIDEVLTQLHNEEAYSAWLTLMLHKASMYTQLYNYTLATEVIGDVATVVHVHGNVQQRLQYYICVASLQQVNGQYDDAYTTLTIAEQLAKQQQTTSAGAQIYYYMSMYYSEQQQFTKSLHYAEQAYAACTQTSDRELTFEMATNLARVYVRTEQLTKAEDVLQTLLHETFHPESAHYTEYVLTRAELLVAQQQAQQADELLRRHIKAVNSYAVQQRVYEVLCPLAKQLHPRNVYIEDMRAYYDVMQQAEQQERNMQMAAISHYFKEEDIQTIAWVDPLTHVYNRKFLTDNVAAWTDKHRNFTVGIFDIDKFKSINDTYGHLVGDEVIQLLAATTVDVLGDESLVIRYGGDEFILLWPHNDRAGIEASLQQLQTAIRALAVDYNGTTIQFTISIGVDLLAMATSEIDKLVKRADEALYEAKNNGRNQYVIR